MKLTSFSYNILLQKNENEEYKSLDPLQPPISAPYLKAMELKRNNFYNRVG